MSGTIAKVAVLAMIGFGLSACDENTNFRQALGLEPPPPPLPIIDAPGDCPAGEYASLIGRRAESEIPKISYAPIRVIQYGQQDISRDYVSTRMNFVLNPEGLITTVGCY